jgi:pimeloyl-ACP methyl ester carboxylesterase
MGHAEQMEAVPHGLLPRGSSALYALGDDPRFSYCTYVPAEIRSGELLVTVHGTGRDAIGIRDAFVPFAEQHGVTILSPLFPAGIDRPDDLDNYKFIRFGHLRFDRLLMRMVVAAERRTGRRLGPLRLVGFSGGAQFVHRFLYLHPGLVASATIAAPGRITLLDDTRDWWAGTRDVQDVFGTSLDLATLRSVPVQVVVGADDTDTGVRSRVEQAKTLHDNYRNHGISSRLDVVPHSRHDLAGLVPPITDFLDGQLRNTGRFAS